MADGPGPGTVVRAFYGITALWTLSASLIWGVNTLFLLEAGLDIFQVFVANAAFTAGQVLFEVPTGMVADTRGRRLSFLLAVGTLVLGTVWYIALYATGASLWHWMLASILLGLGFTFYSGAVEAWFVDAYNASGGTEELDPYFARSAQLFGAGMLVGTICGGLLGQIGLWIPYAARALLLVGLLVLGLLFMHDQGFTPRPFRWRHIPTEVQDIAEASWRHGLKNRPVRLLMLISLLQMGFLMWGWYAWQPYFLELLGKDLVWVAGLIAAGVSVLMIAGNQAVRVLQGKVRRPTVLVFGTILLAGGIVGVGLVGSFAAAVSLFFVAMLGFGLIGPVKQAALHRLIPSGQRATIVSFDGLMASAGAVGSQIGLARLAQAQGYDTAYMVGGIVLTVAIPLAWRFRRLVPRVEGGSSNAAAP